MAKVYSVQMTKDGTQVSYDREPASVIAMLRNGRYTVTFARQREPRSIEQNALMWLWFTCIESETGTHDGVLESGASGCSDGVRYHVAESR